MREANPDTDVGSVPADDDESATTTFPIAPEVLEPATVGDSSVLEPEPASDNLQPQGAEQSSHDGNFPVEQLPATGTQ